MGTINSDGTVGPVGGVPEKAIAAAETGTVAYAGLTATTNSSGWADFDLTETSNFDWGREAYGTTDDSGVTSTPQNRTITLAKYGKVIGGDAAPTSGSWDGTSLTLEFILSTGHTRRRSSQPQPSATW